jgi:two-component system response regulator YesN
LSQTYLKELLLGVSPDIGKYREHFQDMPYGRDGQQHVLVLMKLLDFELLLSRMQEQDLTLLIRSIADLCGQIAGESGCVAYMEHGTFGILLSKGEERSEHAALQWAAGCISRLRSSVELYFNSAPVFVQSAVFLSVESLTGQYAALMRKLEELQGRPSHDADHDVEPAFYLAIHQEKELLSAAEACDTEATAHILQELFASIASHGASPRSLGRLTAELTQLAAKIAQKGGLQADWIFQQMASGHARNGDLHDMERMIVHMYETLVGQLRDAKLSRGYSRYIAQAIERIQSGYKIGLTLEETAAQLRITPAYLSRLFKEETGSTFTEYLTAYRIERSKQLMRTQTGAVKHIFGQVGFNSYSYFIKVFKEHTGETPHAYAARRGK